MPRGEHFVLIGTLRFAFLGYELEMEGGGRWKLDLNRRPKKMLNRRVRIEGKRSEFNMIDVDHIHLFETEEDVAAFEASRAKQGWARLMWWRKQKG